MNIVKKTSALFLATVAVYLLVILSISLLGVSLNDTVSYVLPEFLIMLPSLFFVLKEPEVAGEVHFKFLNLKTFLCCLVMPLVIYPIVTLLSYITSFSGNVVEESVENATSISLPLALLYVAIIPAICEEYVFRGLIYHGLRRRSIFWAIFASALLFGLMHLNLNQFAYAFVIGIALAILVEITDSLLASMIVHGLFNSISVFMSYASNYINAKEAENTFGEMSSVSSTLLTIYTVCFYFSAVVGSVLVLICMLRYIARKNGTFIKLKAVFSKIGRTKFWPENRIINGYYITGVLICTFWIVQRLVINALY